MTCPAKVRPIKIPGNMMKRLIALAVSPALLCCANAYAQNSVTLYGIVDSGIAYVHNAQDSSGANQSSLVKFSSNNLSGSRWGMKGTENIGSGLSAIFQLENGFNVGTGALGQGQREFGRKAMVGLADQTWGTLMLGRQYDVVVDLVQPYTEDGYFGGIFASPGDLDNYDNSLRVSNSVKYVSPTFAGFQFEGMYGLGGVAGEAGNGRTYSFGASYAQGPFAVAAAFFYANGGNTTTSATPSVRTWSSSSDTLFNTVINQGFGSADSIQIARVGAQYNIGAATLGAAYSNTQYGSDSLSAFHRTAKFNNGSAYANYRFSPALLVGLGYNYTSLTGPVSAHYNQLNLGATYSISKRTDFYAMGGYQKASGTTLNSKGAMVSADASIGSFGVNSGTNSQEVVVIGMRHKF